MSELVWAAIGYCAAVIVPVPYISAAILRGWRAIGAKLGGSSTTTTKV